MTTYWASAGAILLAKPWEAPEKQAAKSTCNANSSVGFYHLTMNLWEKNVEKLNTQSFVTKR